MEESPIKVQFRWNADELLAARRYHFRHNCRPLFRIAFHGIFALMLIAGIAGIALGEYNDVPTIVFVIVGVYWFAIRPFERRWQVRRQFRKRPDNDLMITWIITSEQLATESSQGKSEITWTTFCKVLKTPGGLLLYPTEEIFHWLPIHGFQSGADFNTVADFARMNVENYKELG